MAHIELRHKNRVKPKSAYLKNYAKNITSQGGEDGVIEKIFEIIGTDNKWSVEFGAWDGKYCSNTWVLNNEHNWTGVLIEGDAEKFKDLESTYADNQGSVLINQYIKLEGESTLDAILAETEIPKDFDCLSVDVDGLDWHIWDSLKNYQPRFVVIEFNPTIPNDIYFVQDPEPSLNHGTSLLAMIELGKAKGYELVATTAWNAFFVKADLYPLFNIEDNDIDAMHDMSPYESKLFQLYDSSLVLWGNRKLIWKGGMEITQDAIQVLPKEQRKFG
jgi:hypothetical protein